jgi:Ca-activated chloride channel family protein
MIKFILIIFLVINPIADFNDIARVNTLKKEARAAYNNGEFETAINKYNVLMQEYQQMDPNLMLNLSHAYYKAGNMEEAEKTYKPLIASGDMKVRSIANQQLGNMASAKKDYKTALNYYKAALKAAPDNEEARYNYELTKKLLNEQKEQQENEDGEDQEEEQKEDGEDQEEGSESEEEKGDKSEEQEESEKQEGEAEDETDQENQDAEQQEQNEEDQRMEDLESLKEKLEELNMNEETAMMILEALKNQEIQYIQQKRRQSTQPKKSGKPDW